MNRRHADYDVARCRAPEFYSASPGDYRCSHQLTSNWSSISDRQAARIDSPESVSRPRRQSDRTIFFAPVHEWASGPLHHLVRGGELVVIGVKRTSLNRRKSVVHYPSETNAMAGCCTAILLIVGCSDDRACHEYPPNCSASPPVLFTTAVRDDLSSARDYQPQVATRASSQYHRRRERCCRSYSLHARSAQTSRQRRAPRRGRSGPSESWRASGEPPHLRIH